MGKVFRAVPRPLEGEAGDQLRGVRRAWRLCSGTVPGVRSVGVVVGGEGRGGRAVRQMVGIKV